MNHSTRAGLCWLLLCVVFLGCEKEPPRSSDWIAALPDGVTKRKIVVGCTPCHQLGPPVAFRETAQDWEVVYRRMKKIDDDLELSLIPFESGELSDWLGENARMPKQGARIKTAKAEFQEYSLGPWEGFYHDMALAGGRAWIADYFGNVLYGIDPATGEKEEYPIPVAVPEGKPGGAHSIDVARDGSLWVTFTKSEQVARFDPTAREFEMFSGFEPGGNVQYLVLDSERFAHEDAEGRIWVSHFSKEILSRLDPETGTIETFRTARTEGLPEKGVHLYAAVADSKGVLWYTETHGNRLGFLDPETQETEEWEIFEPWAGPKRLAIDDQDRLWIPQLGSGEITVYDTRERKVSKRLPVPIPGDYIYGIRRNRWTGDLWVTGSGSDSLYRLNPETFEFSIFRLPRQGAYTRTVTFDEEGYVWTCYSSYPNTQTRMPHRSGVIVRLLPLE